MPRPTTIIGLCLLGSMLSGAMTPGCASRPSPYRPLTSERQNTETARQLNTEAADLMASDPERAEELLREALTADIYCGPAHNNLGVLLMQRGELYGAANEFEWARRLLPGHPDPRLNLGLTLEKAGKVGDAMDAYRSALEVYPGYLPAIMALTKSELRSGKPSEGTLERLEEIALRTRDKSWRDWATFHLSKTR